MKLSEMKAQARAALDAADGWETSMDVDPDDLLALIACIRELAEAVLNWQEDRPDERSKVVNAILARHGLEVE